MVLVVMYAGLTQFASDALAQRIAAPSSALRWLSARIGWRIDTELARFTDNHYAYEDLTRAALMRSNLAQAQREAVHLPAGPIRNALLEQIAARRGDLLLAQEYALVAPDLPAIARFARQAFAIDPLASFVYARLGVKRLEQLRTHPDALAQGYWSLGLLADRMARRVSKPSKSEWESRSLREYRRAARLAPLSQTYMLSAGTQALKMRRLNVAQSYYAAAARANSSSVDAIAGLGVVAFRKGNRALALQYLEQARRIDSRAPFVKTLEQLLR